MDEARNRNNLLALALLCALLGTLAFQGTRGLYESTEGRYAECAWEMIVSGDYLRPTLDFAPHWTKPPMTYWAIAAGVRLLGRNAWGARAFLVPTFFLTVWGVYWLGRRLWDHRTGSLAALVYATLWGPAGAAFTVNADTLLTLWETLALACFWWAVRSGRKLAAQLMWFFFGLAFFTKGPPALLPLLALVVFRALVQDRALRSAPFWVPSGLGLFLTVGLWWYVLSIFRYPGLLSYWLKHEVVGRVATEEFRRHPHWYEIFTVYWPFLLGGALPWMAVAVWEHRRGLRKGLQGFEGLFFHGVFSRFKTALKKLSPESLFLLTAFFIPFTVFSLSKSKLPLYILPLFPVLACFLARRLDDLNRNGLLTRQRIAAVALVSLSFVIAGKGVTAHWPSKRDTGRIYQALQKTLSGRNEALAPLYLVAEQPYYGLQFYWGGPFVRVHSKSHDMPDPGFRPLSALWEDITLNSYSGAGPRLVVTRKERTPWLQDILREKGCQVVVKPLTPYWALLEVSPT